MAVIAIKMFPSKMFYNVILPSGKHIAVNLSLVRTVTKTGKKLTFDLGPKSIGGSYLWITTGDHTQEIEFETEERAKDEYIRIIETELN